VVVWIFLKFSAYYSAFTPPPRGFFSRGGLWLPTDKTLLPFRSTSLPLLFSWRGWTPFSAPTSLPFHLHRFPKARPCCVFPGVTTRTSFFLFSPGPSFLSTPPPASLSLSSLPFFPQARIAPFAGFSRRLMSYSSCQPTRPHFCRVPSVIRPRLKLFVKRPTPSRSMIPFPLLSYSRFSFSFGPSLSGECPASLSPLDRVMPEISWHPQRGCSESSFSCFFCLVVVVRTSFSS